MKGQIAYYQRFVYQKFTTQANLILFTGVRIRIFAKKAVMNGRSPNFLVQ